MTNEAANDNIPPGPIHNRWALLVGVNRYVEPAFPDLKFCVNDVLALERMLKALGYTVVALHDDAPEERLLPTHDNVEAELIRLCQVAGRDDLLLVHFACHGRLVNGQPVLITRETRKPTLAKKALWLAEVERQMRESKARRLVLTLDACHTGVEIGRDLADPEFIRNAYELAEGFALIAASTAQQVAQEWGEQEHGVFTYYLLEGLSGQADRDDKGFVTVDDLKTHVLDGLRRWNVEHGGLVQEPTARTEGLGDIILAYYRDRARLAEQAAIAPNPFTDVVAIRDPTRFIGREAMLERLMHLLDGGSVALVGERKMGKSSLLHRLADLLRQEPGQVVLFWDFFDPVDVTQMMTEVISKYGSKGEAWEDFKRVISNRRVVMLMDEFDVAPERGFDLDVLRGFRAVCQIERKLRLVTASRILPKEIFPDPGKGSWPYDFLSVQPLGPFTPDEARQLLAHPWAPDALHFDGLTCEELIALSGCHPYRLQRAAHHRYEALCDPTYDWRAAYELDMEALQ